MTNEVKRIPNLRFPGFYGEWEFLNLSKVLKDKSDGIKRGPFGGALKKEIFVSDGYAVYEQQNAIYDTQKFRYFITEQKFQEMKGFSIKENDIIMSCSGTIGKLSLIPSVYKKGIINQALIRFRTNNNILANYFLIYMRSNYMQKKILESNPGSAIVNLIPVKELKKLPFPLPNIKEQQKIGDFFSKLDRQIELEEQKLAKLEEQKKGYMQQIFSQKLRFKDENNNDYPEWKEQKLYEVVKYLSSKRSSNNYSENIMQGDYPVYDAIQEISKDVNFDIKEPYISILKDGAGVGRLNLRPGKSSVIGTMGYLLPENIDINFLFYYLKTMNFNKFVIGSTIPHLYFKDYSKETIFVPKNEEEQFKIGSFFIKLDKVIENKSDKIELLKERKKGFLQRMFV